MSGTAQIWDGVADAWERNADAVDAHMAAATARLLDEAGIGRGDVVIDLATGPGGAGLAAADRVGSSGRVVLADMAVEMVAVAARRAESHPSVRTIVCDQAAIASGDARFDAAISRHGLMFAADPVAAVREVARVLRPGGRYATATWNGRANNPWLGLIFDAVGHQFGVEFPPPGIAGPFSLDAPESLVEALEDGGLEDVRVTSVETPLRAPSLEAWWEYVPQLAGPLANAMAGMEVDVRDAIRDRSLASAAEHVQPDGDGIMLPGSVLIGSGRRPD